MYSLDTVFRDIRSIIDSITVKYESKGKNNDTLESMRAYDLYKLAQEERDTFNLYTQFDERAIRNAGIVDDAIVQLCLLDKFNIPTDKRDLVVYYQRYIIITEFEETNNYYRMLNGLPDVGDTNFIYIDIGIATELEIDYTVPIHQLSVEEIMRLEHIGEIEKLKSTHNKKYLNYLGSYKIPITIAREAKNFAILQMTDDVTENFYTEFHRIYNQCREYYLSVIYIKEFSKRYEYYDSFIAMMIMVMTIQRMLVNTFKYGIDKDFYDLGSIKLLFDSYNVPFIEELPISYQRLLMKNLNNLLRYKSSDKVLYDICSILGFDNIDIYKYFLSKEHIKDDNGKPIFLYKEIIDDETGQPKTVLDVENMFTFRWKSVDTKEKNVPMALLQNANSDDYNTLISDDPFWLDDDDLRKRLYESEFNYIESKYLKMNIMYNMTEIIFETMYFFGIIYDKKTQTTKMNISLPKLFEYRQISIFNVVIFLIALTCKRNSFVGNIIVTPTKTLTVLGFNFKADLTAIRSYIINNKKWVNQNVLNYISNMNISSVSDINRLYQNIDALHDYLVKAMRYSKTKYEYNVHKKLFDTLMITELSSEIFKKSDNTIAETYLDYLKDIDLDLYAFVVGAEGTDISDAIEHILIRISDTIMQLKSSYYLNTDNNIILNALIKLVEFFKSYTTDLTSFNILYLFDDPHFNMLKLISQLDYLEKYVKVKSDILTIKEKIKILLSQMDQRDAQVYRDWIKGRWVDLLYGEDLNLENKLTYEKNYTSDDLIYQPFSDNIDLINSSLQYRDSSDMRDTIKIIYET